MQRKIQTIDMEEIAFEIGEIRNLVDLMYDYLESAPDPTMPDPEFTKRRIAYTHESAIYLTVMSCIGMRLNSLQESIAATLQDGKKPPGNDRKERLC